VRSGLAHGNKGELASRIRKDANPVRNGKTVAGVAVFGQWPRKNALEGGNPIGVTG